MKENKIKIYSRIFINTSAATSLIERTTPKRVDSREKTEDIVINRNPIRIKIP